MNAYDMIELIDRIRNKHRNQKVCIFWDNCKCHRAKDVKHHIESYRRTTMVFNVAYSPLYNGIELQW